MKSTTWPNKFQRSVATAWLKGGPGAGSGEGRQTPMPPYGQHTRSQDSGCGQPLQLSSYHAEN